MAERRVQRNFQSELSGSVDDLPFDASEFINACRLVQDGTFHDGNEDYNRLLISAWKNCAYLLKHSSMGT